MRREVNWIMRKIKEKENWWDKRREKERNLKKEKGRRK